MRYIEVLTIGNLAVEVSPQSHSKQHWLKRFTKWGMKHFIKAQAGNLIGLITAALIPSVSIPVALLVSSLIFYLALENPGMESLASLVVGLALGVLI